LDFLAEHAIAKIVVVAQGIVQALSHLVGYDRRGDELRVRMLQAGPRTEAVVAENGAMGDTGSRRRLSQRASTPAAR
jgi:hypothetical protein